jgi:hypothetical protein
MVAETENPYDAMARKVAERGDNYRRQVLESRPFQDAIQYLEDIAFDFLVAHCYIRLQGARFGAADDFLLFRFAPHMVEAVLAVTQNAREGLQNFARRELRFLLETTVKLSTRDVHAGAQSFEQRLSGLNDRKKRFEDYVGELQYFGDFEKPEEVNSAILSLYAELSNYTHPAVPQFEGMMSRIARGEDFGRESVATLNRFNKLAYQVYDLVLVIAFHSIGLSMAGDSFTAFLDDEPQWRFHKAKYVARLSRCFDYKTERKERREKS